METWVGKKILLYMLLYDEDMLCDKIQNNTKLIWQIRAFEKMGLDVWYFIVKKAGIYLCNKTQKTKIAPPVFGYRGFVHRNSMNNALLKCLKNGMTFDYAYVRLMVAIPSFLLVLRQLHKKKVKVLMEIPTYTKSKVDADANSPRKTRMLFAKVLKLFENQEHRFVDLYVLIGEHADYVDGVKAINIFNGINALNRSDLPQRNHVFFDNNEFHMVMIGHMRSYHGVERIIKGIKEYNNKPHSISVFLHIVGLDADGSLTENKILCKQYGLKDSVIFEGFCVGERLNKICDKCDIGFSALGYYKKEGIVGNELKTREYMSRGIPFVISVPDESLPENATYIYKVPNNDEIIDLNSLITFVNGIKDNKTLVNEMQGYAFDNMTWMPQFRKVLYVAETL